MIDFAKMIFVLITRNPILLVATIIGIIYMFAVDAGMITCEQRQAVAINHVSCN